MQHVRLPLFLAIALAWLIPIELSACGDKYLRLASRLGPTYKAHHPASVLIYMPDQSVVPDVAKALNLHGALRRSGHQVQAVGTAVDLERALAQHRYDIVIADGFSDPTISAIVQRGTGRPTLLPAFSKKTYQVMERSGKMPRCRISAKEVSLHALAEVDHVMELRKTATAVP